MSKPKPKRMITASEMGKRSAEARLNKWGKREFKARMLAYGKMGGRPRKVQP